MINFSPRFSLICQARYLSDSMVDPMVDLTCIYKYVEGDNMLNSIFLKIKSPNLC